MFPKNPPPEVGKRGPAFTDYDFAREFILAGKAKVTLQSHMTKEHFTYKIRKGDGDAWFVHRLTGGNDYVYLGTIFPEGFSATRKTTPKDRASIHFTAWSWFWNIFDKQHRIPRGVSIYHEGQCGRCGNTLTDPVSIQQGYGPECQKRRMRRDFMDKNGVGARG